MEDAGTIHFCNHLRDSSWALCYNRQIQFSERLFISGSYAANANSFDSHTPGQGGLQIREQARPGEVLAIHERVSSFERLQLFGT